LNILFATDFHILESDIPEIETIFQSWNEPDYRAHQLWQGLYQQFSDSPEKFTTFPYPLRQKIAEEFLFKPLDPITTLQSSDKQTTKTLFKLFDGQSIEAVLMRYEKRRTLCISTQAGCAMGCVFCATGQMGFRRHGRLNDSR